MLLGSFESSNSIDRNILIPSPGEFRIRFRDMFGPTKRESFGEPKNVEPKEYKVLFVVLQQLNARSNNSLNFIQVAVA